VKQKVRRKIPSPKMVDARTDRAFYAVSRGYSIDIHRIKEVYKEGKRLQAEGAEGEELQAGILAIVRKLHRGDQ
jgi:hypothetical protein